MSDIAKLIADLVSAEVSAELVGRVAAALAARETVVVKVGDENADRRRASDRQRKADLRLRKSAEICGSLPTDSLPASPPRDIINPPITPPSSTSLRSVERAEPKAKRSKPRTAIGEDQRPTPADAKAAVDAGLAGEQFVGQWRKFRDYHRAKGSLMADWSAAWRTWLGNMAAYQRAGPKAFPPERQDPWMRAGMALIAEMTDEANFPSPHENTAGPIVELDAIRSESPPGAGRGTDVDAQGFGGPWFERG